MTRTILYYPTIQIKSSKWIKRTILYWDVVGSIVPYDFDYPQYCLEHMLLLRDYGAYRPYHPEDFVRNDTELCDEFEAIRQSNEFKTLSGEYSFERRDFRIYLPKVNPSLANRLLNSESVDQEGEWLLFTQQEGMLYMSLLAKYLADGDHNSATVPGTDWGGYQQLAVGIPISGYLSAALSLRLDSVLPVPRESVPLKQILSFKGKRREELLEFRKTLLEFQEQLKAAKTNAEIQEDLASFSESLELGVSNLVRLADEEKLPTVLGTIESLFSMSLPDVVSIAAGATIDPTIAAIGIAGSGTVKVSKYLIDKANERRKKLNKDAYSYIYHAQKEGII